MNEPQITTVVLNYKTYQDAIECVHSLLSMDYSNHHIVIVENGSGNESAQELKKIFDGNPMVSLLVSTENLGFAKGNNLGIRYAREKQSANFVFVLNSDTIVPRTLFRDVVTSYENGIGVISPQVVNIVGEVLNPSENSDDIVVRAKKQIRALYLARFLMLPGIKQIYSTYHKAKGQTPQKVEVSNSYKKYVLQGCSYFLTPDFFKYYTNIFPETFLYWEEIDLLLFLQKVGLRSICIQSAPVVHKISKSTTELFGVSKYERRKIDFSYQSMKKSRPMFPLKYEELKRKYNV